MRAKLIITQGKTATRSISVSLPATIGRSRKATVTIGHPMISRQHCELFVENGQIKLRDLGSLNGTYLGDRLIEGDAILGENEEFSIGPIAFRVCSAEGDPSPRAEGDRAADASPGGALPDLEIPVASLRPASEAAPPEEQAEPTGDHPQDEVQAEPVVSEVVEEEVPLVWVDETADAPIIVDDVGGEGPPGPPAPGGGERDDDDLPPAILLDEPPMVDDIPVVIEEPRRGRSR